MSINLSPYLVFNGQAREALAFYASVFGGEPVITTAAQMGAPEGWPPDAVMHGQLDSPAGFTVMAADSTKPGDEVVRGGLNLTFWGDDESLHGYFDKLAADGTVTMPLEKQMWGDFYGDLTDKFGINWGFNISSAGD